MKTNILLVAILIGLAQARISYLDVVEEEFRSFKEDYQKVYENVDEELKRMQIFMDNKKLIDSHNERYAAGEETYEMAVNQFTDLLPSEFQSQMLTDLNVSEMTADVEYAYFPDDLKAPSAIDWRVKGAVTPVKNQKHCGSCWAFAATGVLESRHFLKYHKLIPLSEQNLIDCSGRYGNNGCTNGSVLQALLYVKNNGGLDTEKAYPYKARNGQCRFNRNAVGATVSQVVQVPQNENALANAVASGPVAVSIDASNIHFYKSGVFSGPCPKKPHHAVLVVGYDKNYWLIKNSWGSDWGEHGYFRLARNHNNLCQIATYAFFPVI